MADTTALKNRIRAAIKSNDNQEITGPVLQQALLDMVDELNGATETEANARQNGDSTLQQGINTERQQRQDADTALQTSINTERTRAEEAEQTLSLAIINLRNAGYAFGGTAATETDPGVPFNNCFYIVRGAGTYSYFKNADNESIVLENDGVYVLTYEAVENNYWEWNLIVGIDNTLTDGSNNLVKSGEVYKELHRAAETEADARQNGDSTLQQGINTERQQRQDADTALQTSINTERTRAEEAEQTLSLAIINLRNAGYALGGIATTETDPGVPFSNCFYIVRGAGTYSYFKNADNESIVLENDGVYVLTYESVENHYWEYNLIVGIDNVPTQDSNNLVKSGGVFDEVMKNGSAFDLSAYNGGATYTDLNAALIALNALPAAYKRGGMSMNFVQSSDNKYLQYRCMAQNFTTDVTQWQGVDDESTPGSDNLVKSGGVELSKAKNSLYGTPLANLPLFNLAINSSGILIWGKHSFIPLKAGDTISITVDTTISAAFVKSLPVDATVGDSPDYCDNTSAIALNTSTPSFEGTAPDDVKYILISRVYGEETDRTSGIVSVKVNGFDIVKGLYTNYKSVLDDVTELKTNLAISDAIAKDANGVILGSENLELTSDPTQNTPILSLSNLSIPVGKKLRIRMGGVGTVITSYGYSLNSGSLVTGNTEQIKDIEVETTITNILIVLRSNTFIASGTVTAEVDVYGVSTGIIEDIDKLKGDNSTNEKNIYDDKAKTLGMNIGNFNGTPIVYASTPETAEIYSSYIPSGCKVRVVTSGIGTAVSKLSCKINDGTAINITTDIFEFVTEVDVTNFRIYSASNSIIDNTKTLVISANVIGTKQEAESLRSDVTVLQNNEIRVFGKNLFSYNGYPTVLPYYLDSREWNYPAGKYVIKCTGIGTVITLYNIKINGGSRIAIDTDVYEFEIGDGQTLSALRIYTSSNNIIDDQKTVTFSVYYYGLANKVDDLEDKVNNIGAQKDFDTEYIVEYYATEPTSNEFANSFSFAVNGDKKLNENIIVSSYAMFKNLVDDTVPIVQFTYKDSENTTIYTSPAYTFGKKDDYIQKEWRLPAFPYDCNLIVAVTIPTNVTLYIKEFSNRYSDSINRLTDSYRMNAHTSLYGNFNNIDAFVLSAKVGYPCCICVPKRTSDGVWVCYHDDGAVGTRLLDENHQQLSAEEQEKTISQFTYARLSQLTYRENNGIYRHVPTLEEFFLICSKTGMHPMFSWHPLVTNSQAEEVKALAAKFGLLKYLNIKLGFGSDSSDLANMSVMYSIFGNDIESYTGDINNDDAIEDIISNLDAINFDITKVRVGLEFFNARVTVEKVQATLTAGYFAAIAWMTANPTGEDMEYWIKQGVTEFTEYNNYSNGLNW